MRINGNICIKIPTKSEQQKRININCDNAYFLDPPVVWPNNVTFNGMNRPRTLTCNVSGEPNTYNFTWSHYLNSKDFVRTFNSGSDGVLILPEGETKGLVFEDSGFYICNVSNGVPDENRNLWQSGKIKVMVEGKIKQILIFRVCLALLKKPKTKNLSSLTKYSLFD